MTSKMRSRTGSQSRKAVSKPLSGIATSGEELTPRQSLLRQILSLRNSIEAEKGILSESYPLIREDRER